MRTHAMTGNGNSVNPLKLRWKLISGVSFNYLKPVCAVAHRRDNDSGKKMPSSSQRRERRLDRAVIMMMPIIAKFALVLMPPSPRLLIRVKNAFTVYLMVKRYFSQFLTS